MNSDRVMADDCFSEKSLLQFDLFLT